MTPPRAGLLLGALAIVGAGAARVGRVAPAGPMSLAAQRWLDTLTPELRARAAHPFESPDRTNWQFVPGPRAGITLADMTDDQRAAARDLLRSALSSRGVLKVESIVRLESILHDLEAAAGSDASARDAGRYTFAVFGSPPGPGPWGWRVEGHHLSLNFSSVRGELDSATPAFLGANPARVERGPHAGLRVLAAEEDLARELLASLDDARRARATLPGAAPREIILAPGRRLDPGAPAGLPGADMTPAQRDLLERLVREYADNLRPDAAAAQLERMHGAGVDRICFAWAGGTGAGQGHYYRVQGPTFVIEYDNTQNDANHVHTVWHDLTRDFGADLLREHYEHSHAR